MGDVLNLRNKKLPGKSQTAPAASPVPARASRVHAQRNAHEQKDSPSPMAQTVAWHAPTTYHRHRLGITVMSTSIVALGAAGFLLWQGEYLGGIVFIAGGLGIFLFSRTPRVHTVLINPTGITIDDALLAWNDFHSFWIDYRPQGVKELSLESAHWYRPHIRILLADQDPLAIRRVIISFIPEREHSISLIDFWTKRY